MAGSGDNCPVYDFYSFAGFVNVIKSFVNLFLMFIVHELFKILPYNFIFGIPEDFAHGII